MLRIITGSVCGFVLVLAGMAPAQAGETKGNGEPIESQSKAHSVCSFSGQDLPDELENQPNRPDDEFTDGHVQTYGMYVRAGIKAFIPSPGDECRGNLDH